MIITYTKALYVLISTQHNTPKNFNLSIYILQPLAPIDPMLWYSGHFVYTPVHRIYIQPTTKFLSSQTLKYNNTHSTLPTISTRPLHVNSRNISTLPHF